MSLEQPGLSEADEAYANWLRHYAVKMAGRLNSRKMAVKGKGLGSLSPQETTAVEGKLAFPQRIVDRLFEIAAIAQRESGNEGVLVAEAEKRRHAAPIMFGSSVLGPAFNQGTVTAREVRCFHIHNAKAVLTAFNKTVSAPDGVIPSLSNPRGEWLPAILPEKSYLHLPGKTLVAHAEGSGLFSHWLLDALPRIFAAEIAGHPRESFDRIVVNTDKRKYHKEVLARLGFRPDQVVCVQETGLLLTFEEAVFVSPPRWPGFVAGEWIYEKVGGLFGGAPERLGDRRILISRAGADRRRALNETRLLEIAANWGYEPVRAEAMTMVEMAQVIRESNGVIAPHGAGLANLAFGMAGTAVLELYGLHISTEFWQISCHRGMRYHCLQGWTEDAERLGAGFFSRNGADYTIDEDVFREALTCMHGAA